MTKDIIDAARTAAGGWDRATLAGWGVPWPPPKGWRKALIEQGIGPDAEAMRAKRKRDRDMKAAKRLAS